MLKTLVIALSTALLAALPAFAAEQPLLAATPPMGWNSWNHYGCSIDETLIRNTADAMVSSGLRDAGYVNINLDDCWHGDRDAEGNIQPDAKRFPTGMKALGDYLHARGLRFGIYSDTGEKTCAGRPGSQGYEFQDARQYARWGVDYIKYDWCNVGKDEWQRNAREGYATMQRAIVASGRSMILSICEWGDNKPWIWGAKVGQLWRTTGDITNCWDCVLGHGTWQSNGIMQIVDRNEPLRAHAGPGHWNDPDMMEVGNMASFAEDRSHFALWAMMAAPLITGTDITNLKPEVLAILGNKAIIAIDQDPLGIQGFRWIRNPDHEIWAKPLSGGDWAIAVTNRGDAVVRVLIDWQHAELNDNLTGNDPKFGEKTYALTDLWRGQNAGTTAVPLTLSVPPHDTAIYRLSAMKGGGK